MWYNTIWCVIAWYSITTPNVMLCYCCKLAAPLTRILAMPIRTCAPVVLDNRIKRWTRPAPGRGKPVGQPNSQTPGHLIQAAMHPAIRPAGRATRHRSHTEIPHTHKSDVINMINLKWINPIQFYWIWFLGVGSRCVAPKTGRWQDGQAARQTAFSASLLCTRILVSTSRGGSLRSRGS